MGSSYLAHISDQGETQSVLEHLRGTAALAQSFARPFGGDEQAFLAGMIHDIGKYSQAFQKHLHGAPIQVDHATAGAVECWRRRQIPAAFAVAGHHSGLPDGGSQPDSRDQATLWGRIKRAGSLEPYGAWEQEVTWPQAGVPDFLRKQSGLELMFFIRMLYSCLVDADFLDTEAFMEGQRRENSTTTIKQLWDSLQEYISGWFPPRGELNTQRCKILKRCMEEGETRAPGLFSLTVPTGGGKTVASLAFALAHAKKHGLRRVIYVIPYTSIIEQTAEVFREILGEENVLEHHSNVLYDPEEADVHTIRLAKATENWDIPVVVTTAVQFFESLYACRSSQCRKLHNIADSVVILDEGQMLPVPYLRPCIWAISQLVEHYGVSAVFCTATQPALEKIFQEFLPQLPMRELCPPDTCQWEVFRRVRFQKAGSLTWDELAAQLNTHSQVLCIVNTKEAAQEVYGRLKGEGSFHLSALMCPRHRKEQLREIRRRLKEGLCCRVVSTSLIEAGVDVDFPTVFREQAGLDSVLQAAGYRIYVKDGVPLNRHDEEAYAELDITEKNVKGKKKADPDLDRKIRDWMCKNFYDIRTFGAVMTTFSKAALNCGQVRGPVQLGFARSIEEITPQAFTIARVTRATQKEMDEKGPHTFGDKYIVPYGLYRCEGYISANLARKTTGFSEEDLSLLWEAILNMFEHDHSAARGKMAVRELIVFKHDSELGCAPAWKLFDAVKVGRKDPDNTAPARSYQDYTVSVDETSLPGGVTCQRMG